MCIEILASFGSAVIAKQHPKPVIISNSCCVLYRSSLTSSTSQLESHSVICLSKHIGLFIKNTSARELSDIRMTINFYGGNRIKYLEYSFLVVILSERRLDYQDVNRATHTRHCHNYS